MPPSVVDERINRTKDLNELLRSGDIAPDFKLHTVDGQSVSLEGVRRQGRAILLVFLRHLG